MRERRQPKLLICFDVAGWAQHRHASGLAKYAPPDLLVHAVDRGSYCQWSPGKLSTYTAVYIISLALAERRPGVRRLISCVASHAWIYPRLNRSNWRTYGVNKRRCSGFGEKRLATLDAVTCRNGVLAGWARGLCRRVAVFPAGVDREVFRPGEFRPVASPLRVGWCGQAGGITNFKGHDEIVAPLVDALPQYEWSVNRRNYENALSPGEMAEWYRSLDVFLCTSSADGTPNPPFEAAACGVPVISTDVGQVSDWAAMRGSRFLVDSYSNEREAEVTRAQIVRRLAMLEDSTARWEHRERLLASIEEHYDYAKLAPRTLQWILGKDDA